MKWQVKLFVSLLFSTLVLALIQTQLPSESVGWLIPLALAIPVVIMHRERQNLQRGTLPILAAGSFVIMIAILSSARLKNRTLSFWSAVLDFFLVCLSSCLMYWAFLAIRGFSRYIQHQVIELRERAARIREAEQATALAIQSELDQFVSNATEGSFPDETSSVTGVVLRQNERCCAYARNVQYVVNRKRTSYVGGSQGVSFRIAKGVRYHIGAYKGHRVTTVDQVVADNGSLYVTDKRVIFAGVTQVITITLKQIADVRVFGDGLAVMRENKAQPLMFSFAHRAPIIGAAIRAMIDSHLQVRA